MDGRHLYVALMLGSVGLAVALAGCGTESVEPAGRRYHVEAIADNGEATTVVSADEGPRGQLTDGQLIELDDGRRAPAATFLWHYGAGYIRAHCPCTFETTGDSREVRIVRERHKVAPGGLAALPVTIRLPAYVAHPSYMTRRSHEAAER